MSVDAPRLYLITPLITDAAAFAAPLAAALAAGDVACVWLRFDSSAAEASLEKLVPLVQKGGAACLVDDLAQAAQADGVHVMAPGAALGPALKAMKPQRIVGVGGLLSRDDAMRAGEAGVDYLMFGGPDEAQSLPEIRERVVWWAEIFNVACVAYAQHFGDVAPLAAAGADFVALGPAVWDMPEGPAHAVAAANSLLASGQPA